MDPSLWGVVFGNALSAFMAFTHGWTLAELMWVFWAQSLIIGIINVKRMLSLKEFSTEGLTMNDRPVPEHIGSKISVAFFFTLHYGFFHFVYFFFIWQEGPLSGFDRSTLLGIAICIGGFFLTHSYSFKHNFKNDFKDHKPNIGTLMFYPYMRIFPLHFTIIFGSMMQGHLAMALFLILKTLADCGMHIAEHRMFRKPSNTALRTKD